MRITTIHTVDTAYSADSVEWCTHPEYQDVFACGTYQLECDNTNSASPPCRRKGRIYLYHFNKDARSLYELQRLETAAILDMKWLPKPVGKPVLAVANALGQVEVYELIEGQLQLRATSSLNPEYHNLLALSLDWDWQPNETARKIVASDSKGAMSLLEYRSTGEMEKLHSWPAHSFEAWICCFDKWDMNRVYTGGDDSFLHIYDIRTYERTFTNRSHIAGVTSLLSHPVREHILLTGSYDERLRIFDTRSLNEPLGELNLGGGIWRIKSDPLNRDLILVACMYHNFSIVRFPDGDLGKPTLAKAYEEHKSICYGADWSLNAKPGDKDLFMATCSFYDNKLCLSCVSEDD